MQSIRQIVFGLAFCGAVFVFSSPAFAHSKGHCADHNATGNKDCQFEVDFYTQAPSVAASAGVRLDGDAVYVLFNNYPVTALLTPASPPPATTPLFVSNNGGKDIFVPQGTAAEWSAFLKAPRGGATVGYAVVPQTYSAPPTSYADCDASVWSPNPVLVSIPVVKNSLSPITVNYYTFVPDPAHPENLSTAAGATTQGSTPARFTYTRKDCSTDNEGNSACADVAFEQDQRLVFAATGTTPNFNWDTQHVAVTTGLYVSVNGGTYSPATDCTTTYAPAINGTCGLANGSSSLLPPTANLCATGDASAVTGGSGSWSWTCNGVGTGSTSQNCSTAVNCTLPWGGSISVGSTITAYQSQTVTCGETCQQETLTCNADGTLSGGGYQYGTCGVGCTLPWGACLASGDSVTAYEGPTVPNGQTCVFETRTCTNGTLAGSYTYQNCKPGCAGSSTNWTNGTNACAGSYSAMNAGDTATVTNTASNTTGTETATCASDGSGTVTFSNASCTKTACDTGYVLGADGKSCVLSCTCGSSLNSDGQCVCPAGLYWDGSGCICPDSKSWNGSSCVCSSGVVASTGACGCKLMQMDSGVTRNGGGILMGGYFVNETSCTYPPDVFATLAPFKKVPDCPAGAHSGGVYPYASVPIGWCKTAITCDFAGGCGGDMCTFGAVWGLSCVSTITYPPDSCHTGGGGGGGGGCPHGDCQVRINAN